jgi:uncharacterized delta-60 repeat protein
MKRTMKIILLLAGMVTSGIWTAAYGQTGDCYVTLPGCLDRSFGVDGKVTSPAGMTVNGLAIQYVGGEARIVAVGFTSASGTSNVWTVVRYHTNGTLDDTFGNGGMVQESFKKGDARAMAVAVQPDNKLVVVGYAPPPVQGQFAVARYNENGSRDLSFGDPAGVSGGMVLVPYPNIWGTASAVALQSDGKIVATGCYGYRLAVVRLNPNGTLDTAFNGSGRYVHLAAQSDGRAVTIQKVASEERIVVAGSMVATKAYTSASLLRFTPNGTLDPTFGVSGVVVTDFTNYSNDYFGVAVDPTTNRLLAGGTAVTSEAPVLYQLAMARYDQFGTLDPSFGSGGKVSPPPQLMSDSTSAIAIQPDGHILVTGQSLYSGSGGYMANWRFTDDGALDPLFGSNGWVTTSFADSSFGYANALALQPDGKFVSAGTINVNGTHRASLVRYYEESLAHDIAVLGISPSANGIIQGDPVSVLVTVGNNGQSLETADVTVTESPGGTNLGTESVTLGPGETIERTFMWQTNTSTTTGDHTLQATATITTSGIIDEQPLNNSRTTTVNVAPAVVNITLSAHGYKLKGVEMVDLSWTGASNSSVDIYRNGTRIKTTNSGTYTDTISVKGAGSYTYKVCTGGTSPQCSNSVTVVF